jgi:hypothetical protein
MGDVQTTERPGKRGLSRRDMIRGAAVAGAAAWTAPMIIDSLTSPAAAYSGTCVKYAVKLQPRFNTTAAQPLDYDACFGGIANTACFPASDAKWGGSGSAPTSSCTSGSLNACSNANCSGTGGGPVFCPSGNSDKLSTMSLSSVTLTISSSNVDYQKLVMNGTCGFSNSTDWQFGGRYPPGSPGDQFKKITAVCPSSAGPTSATPDGCYWGPTNTAWVRRYYSGTSDEINYLYVKFCCKT